MLKYVCKDTRQKIKYLIFDEELWLCAEHYTLLQNEVLTS